jgi:hypothetical protein
MGTATDPLEIGGSFRNLTLGGDGLDPNPASMVIHMNFASTRDLPKIIQYIGNYRGFVLWNGQIIYGPIAKIREINRALAFTVNTPELKSTQGVFGEPAFIHQGMAVSDAYSMGVVNGLSLNDIGYYGTFGEIEDSDEIDSWDPPVNLESGPLAERVKEISQQRTAKQPDIVNLAE